MPPLNPVTALKIGSMVPDLFKTIAGGFQFGKGNKLENEITRPLMDIPESAKEALSLARNQASQKLLPGQGYYETQLDKNQSRSLAAVRESATNPAQIAEAALRIGDQTDDSILNMAIRGAERYDMNQRNLQDQLGAMADWEQLQFEMNELEPFLDDAALASSLQGAGLQNMFGGLDSLGANAASFAETLNLKEILGNLESGEGKSLTESLTEDTSEANSIPFGDFSLTTYLQEQGILSMLD